VISILSFAGSQGKV